MLGCPVLGARKPDNRTTGNRTTGNRTTGNRTTGQPDNRKPDNRTTGNRTTGNRTTGNRTTGNRTTGNRKPDNRKPETGQPETGNRTTGNRKPDNRKPETGQPETGNRKPDNRKPETGQPETGQPETGQPETGQPETGQPETGQPETGQPETGQPDNRKPDNQKNLPMARTDIAPIKLARNVLRGQYLPPDEMLDLFKDLKAASKFGYARRIMALLRRERPNDLWCCQQQALCTYKDLDLASDIKFDRAIDILSEEEDINATTNSESLGMLGSIHKTKWKFDNQLKNLRIAYHYYRRGYEEWLRQLKAGSKGDEGYNAINAAYVLDLMAVNEIQEAQRLHADSPHAEERLQEADQIRRKIIEHLPVDLENCANFWLLITLAEAHFGLQQFKESEPLLQKAAELMGPGNWQYESSAKQLASIAEMQLVFAEALQNSSTRRDRAEAEKALHTYLGDAAAVAAAFKGKVGLALSGGGFRASLFHIGVLARLAEMDVLRHVEVLSCVSGGSILGAYYYLEVKKLLESKSDEEISRDDYVQLVKNIEKNFLTGIQNNLRIRVITNFLSNIKMIFSSNYTRTQKLGELYEELLYRPVLYGKDAPDKPIKMEELFIKPKGEEHFSFKSDNWRRRNKIPNLIINATSLNTGHNWQFTASWMGEPPGSIVNEVDAKYRLRRMYYYEAPGAYKNMNLGFAVAASSCVPGLFEPLILDDLYEEDVKLQLVDGGVHDNQGVVGLLEQECQLIFVSDSSGQLTSQENANSGMVNVLGRTNSILMERVRECLYLDLKSRKETGLIKDMLFVHLKKDLTQEPLDWIDCEDPHEIHDLQDYQSGGDELTTYGIRKDVQRLLAGVRTDLDTFNDAEAFALMYSGYQMTALEHERSTERYFENAFPPVSWNFMKIADHTLRTERSRELNHLLKASQKLFFKVFMLSKLWLIAGLGFAIGMGGLIIFLVWKFVDFDQPIISINLKTVLLAVLTFLIATFLGGLIAKVIDYESTIRKVLIGIALALAGFIVGNLYLNVLDKVYLKKGRIV